MTLNTSKKETYIYIYFLKLKRQLVVSKNVHIYTP